jgi:hypothetical protein
MSYRYRNNPQEKLALVTTPNEQQIQPPRKATPERGEIDGVGGRPGKITQSRPGKPGGCGTGAEAGQNRSGTKTPTATQEEQW